MAFLVDTNVLIFSVQQDPRWRGHAARRFRPFPAEGKRVFLQNIAEFWNVCTRPLDKNGLGLTPAETQIRLEKLVKILTVLHDIPEVYTEWRRLIPQREVRGVQVNDARIAAAMRVHKVRSSPKIRGISCDMRASPGAPRAISNSHRSY